MLDKKQISAEKEYLTFLVEQHRPNTRKALCDLVAPRYQNFEVKTFKYLGFVQGVKVTIKLDGQQFTVPGNGKVWPIYH